jgi:hypothetical protein
LVVASYASPETAHTQAALKRARAKREKEADCIVKIGGRVMSGVCGRADCQALQPLTLTDVPALKWIANLDFTGIAKRARVPGLDFQLTRTNNTKFRFESGRN